MRDDRIAVLGAGSWGTALAMVLARNGAPTLLWARSEAHVADMQRDRRNARYIPATPLPDGLDVTADLGSAVAKARDLVLAVPSHAFVETLQAIGPHLRADARLIWATKGFEPGRGRFLHEVVAECLSPQIPGAVISGPTFAAEVAAELPAAVTVASRDGRFATAVSKRFHNSRFRVYTGDDLVGVQFGGGVKNALAIAAGIADGLGFGANTRAALITRGLAELVRVGTRLGGRRETFMGLAGLGDLVLTCTDDQSRNRRVGLALGRGQSLAEAVRSVDQVVEGIAAAAEVSRVAAGLGVETPIIHQVNQVVHHGVPPRDAVNALLTRAAGPERV